MLDAAEEKKNKEVSNRIGLHPGDKISSSPSPADRQGRLLAREGPPVTQRVRLFRQAGADRQLPEAPWLLAVLRKYPGAARGSRMVAKDC
jgi:hypothetical protein